MSILLEISKAVSRLEKQAAVGTNHPANFISLSRGRDGRWKQDAVEYAQFRPVYKEMGEAIKYLPHAAAATALLGATEGGKAVLDGGKLLQRGALGALGGVLGAGAGFVDAGRQYGFRSLFGAGDYKGAARDAWSHVGRVAQYSAEGGASKETANRFNGLVGSALANTAYNFVPGMVSIFSDAGAQKVLDAQDAIGLGNLVQKANDYNARAHEAQFRKIYGDESWEDFVRDPYTFAKSHPELTWSELAETIGRTSIDLAAGLKGFGGVGKTLRPFQKMKGVGQVFKHPLATSAAVGTASGVKNGIESGSVLQGMSTGFGDATMMSMLLGGKPIATTSMFGGSIASNPDIHWAVKDMYNQTRGRELDYRDPQIKDSTYQSLQFLGEQLKELKANPNESNKYIYDALNNGRAYLDEDDIKQLDEIGRMKGW